MITALLGGGAGGGGAVGAAVATGAAAVVAPLYELVKFAISETCVAPLSIPNTPVARLSSGGTTIEDEKDVIACPIIDP